MIALRFGMNNNYACGSTKAHNFIAPRSYKTTNY